MTRKREKCDVEWKREDERSWEKKMDDKSGEWFEERAASQIPF